VQLSRGDVDLCSLLSDLVDDHAIGSHRDIRLDVPADPLRVQADERLLNIVFDNLVENAIKYSPDGSVIDVDLRRDGTNAVIAVRDHGGGFDEPDIERVFERFYRSGSVRRKPGVGLGLYMVRRIVELHGGHVHAGNAEGAGAVVTVALPAVS
jgi:signal transduction histidine kinase